MNVKQRIESIIYRWAKIYGKKVGLDLPYFIKNGFWVFFRQGVGAIAGLALSVAFARLATQEVFGQYQFVLSVLSIVSILSVPGLNTAVIQSVARGNDGDYKLAVKTSFFWSLLGIPTLLAVGAYYYAFQSHPLGIALMIASIFFPFLYAPNTWDSFLQGKSRFDISAKYASVQTVLATVTMIIVIFFSRQNLISITVAYLILYTFFNGYYYFKSLKYMENRKKDEDTIKYGWFLTKIGILNIIASNLDKIMIGIFLSPSQLAIYSIGILLPKQLQNITKSLLGITVPKQIQQKDISKGNYFKIFFISIVMLIIAWLVLPFLVNLLYSQKYNQSINLAKLSILFYPFFVLALVYKNKFLFNKKERNIKIESIGTPIIKIIFIFLLLPFFGMKGLAFLFSFQYIITLVILYLSEAKNKKITV